MQLGHGASEGGVESHQDQGPWNDGLFNVQGPDLILRFPTLPLKCLYVLSFDCEILCQQRMVNIEVRYSLRGNKEGTFLFQTLEFGMSDVRIYYKYTDISTTTPPSFPYSSSYKWK